MPVPAAQAFGQACSQAAIRCDLVAWGDSSAEAAPVARADCAGTGTGMLASFWPSGPRALRNPQQLKLSEQACSGVDFCNPHSLWPRITNGNMFGLVRQYPSNATNLGMCRHGSPMRLQMKSTTGPDKKPRCDSACGALCFRARQCQCQCLCLCETRAIRLRWRSAAPGRPALLLLGRPAPDTGHPAAGGRELCQWRQTRRAPLRCAWCGWRFPAPGAAAP